MLTRTRQLAIALVTALLWSGLGGAPLAHAGPVLTTPAGLAPGAHFRFAFITDRTTTAFSSNITDYDNFVNTQAGGATYNGTMVTWQVIGSTASVNAIDHTTGPTNDPVYLSDGTLVATSTTTSAMGLWSGTLQHAINEDQTGRATSFIFVWTGTSSTGTAVSGGSLGPFNVVESGVPQNNDSTWVESSGFNPADSFPLYGISTDLIVPASVPEPSSWLTLGIGLSATTLISWSRHRRDRRRQKAGRPPESTE
jgi:hypothetical protein